MNSKDLHQTSPEKKWHRQQFQKLHQDLQPAQPTYGDDYSDLIGMDFFLSMTCPNTLDNLSSSSHDNFLPNIPIYDHHSCGFENEHMKNSRTCINSNNDSKQKTNKYRSLDRKIKSATEVEGTGLITGSHQGSNNFMSTVGKHGSMNDHSVPSYLRFELNGNLQQGEKVGSLWEADLFDYDDSDTDSVCSLQVTIRRWNRTNH